MAYDAFISYSHAADGRLAPALQSALQRFAKPWHRRRALHVFRDQSSLAATPELWPSIEAALNDSSHFLLLASPEAAQSKWVRREINHWRATKPAGSIFVVLTGGDLVWDEAANDFDWARTDALPPDLLGTFPSEPLWVDLRWAHGETQLSLKHPRFLEAVGDLAAPLHGRPKEDLLGEDVRQHRRAVRLAAGVVVALALLLVAALGGTMIAVQQRAQAEAAGQIALGRQLAAQAANARTGRLDTRLLLSLEANRLDPGAVAARGSLLDLLSTNSNVETFLPGQRDRVDVVRFRPDTAVVATAGADGVILWDAVTSQPLAGPVGAGYGKMYPVQMEFAPDGSILATSVQEGIIAFLDGSTLAEKATIGLNSPAPIVALAFSPDGTTLAAAGYETDSAHAEVTIWDIASGALLAALPAKANDIAFGDSGQTLITAGSDGALILWDWRQETVIADDLLPYFIDTVVVSPNGQTFIFDSADGAIEMRNATTLAVTGELPAPQHFLVGAAPVIKDIAFSGDGSTVFAASEDGAIYRWDTRTRKLAWPPLEAHGAPVLSLHVSPDGERLVSSAANGTVVFWSVDPLSRLRDKLNRTSNSVFSVTSDGTGRLVVGDAFGRVGFWEPRADAPSDEILIASGTSIQALGLSKDSRLLATGDAVGIVRIWDLATRQMIVDPTASHLPDYFDNRDDYVYDVRFIRDDQVLASVAEDDGAIDFWDVATGEPLGDRTAARANFEGSSLALSPDGRVLAEGTNLGVRLIDVATLKQIGDAILGPEAGGSVASVAYSPDGRVLAVSGEGGIVLVDVASREQIAEMTLPQGGWVNAVAFSPDGLILAAGAGDGSLRLWDVSSRQVIGQLASAHRDWIRSLVFAPDGRSLVSNDNAGNLIRWNMNIDAWVAAACAIAGRNLTTEEWAQYVGDLPYGLTCPEAVVATPELGSDT